MDALFLRQVWAGNEALLIAAGRHVAARPRAAALLPRSTRARGRGSITTRRSSRASPAEAAAGELLSGRRHEGGSRDVDEARSPEAEHAQATGFFTTIRRDAGGQAVAIVPYSVEYQGELARGRAAAARGGGAHDAADAEGVPREARRRVPQQRLLRSDVAWMELDASIEPTIGPYEVYEDEWFNYKAAFEAFITVRDDAETQKLARFGGELQELENHLPIDPKLRNPKLGALRADPRRQRACSPPATAIAACRRPPTTCPTTSASSREKGSQARDAEEHAGGEVREGAAADRQGRARRGRPARTSRSTPSSRTSSCTS